MKLVLLADVDDDRGFRLAGVDSTRCRTRLDIERAVADLVRHGEGELGVVLVSESVYQLAPRVIDALRETARWPLVVVLPEQAAERRPIV